MASLQDTFWLLNNMKIYITQLRETLENLHTDETSDPMDPEGILVRQINEEIKNVSRDMVEIKRKLKMN